MFKQTLRLVLLPAAAAVLVACGGGGGSAQQAASLSFNGVVAVGAALSGAKVDVHEASGELVGSTTTAEDGSYTINIPATAKMPFTFKAVKEEIVLFSPVASSNVTRVNVTPLTNLVAAQLSPTGNPAQLIEQIKSGAAVVDSGKVQAVVVSLNEALDPLLKGTNARGVDPISGEFKANGAGYDQALNSLNIAINPTGQSSNIIITVKSASSATEELPEIKFVSDKKPPVLPEAVANATLIPSSTDSMVQAFLAKLNSCYQLPSSDRVEGQSSVKAEVCRQIFYNNDPKTFKNNGAEVGKDKAWASLWNPNSQDIRFTSGNALYLDKNGDMLISWRNESKDGNVSFSRTWARPDNGQLKSYGNQFLYPFTVKPTSEARESINTNKSYFSTGFDIYLANLTAKDSNNKDVPIFERVVVTAPNGRTIEFFPQSSLSYLSIGNTSTSIIRLAGHFWDAELGNRQPRELNENIVWAKNKNDINQDWSSSEIESIKNIGNWKAEFFLKGNKSNTPDSTQFSVVTSRPLTIEEIKNRAFVKLIDSVKAEARAVSGTNGYIPFEEGDQAEVVGQNGTDVWVVPEQAIAPTLVKVAGHYVNDDQIRSRWDDSISVSTRARKTIIKCSKQTSSDNHCSVTKPDGYSDRSRMDMVQLFATDQNEMQWWSFFAIYKAEFKAN